MVQKGGGGYVDLVWGLNATTSLLLNQVMYCPAVFGHFSPPPPRENRSCGTHPINQSSQNRLTVNQTINRKVTMKVYAWLIDLIHRRRNCPMGMISGWVQKVTQHNGIIQCASFFSLLRKFEIWMKFFSAVSIAKPPSASTSSPTPTNPSPIPWPFPAIHPSSSHPWPRCSPCPSASPVRWSAGPRRATLTPGIGSAICSTTPTTKSTWTSTPAFYASVTASFPSHINSRLWCEPSTRPDCRPRRRPPSTSNAWAVRVRFPSASHRPNISSPCSTATPERSQDASRFVFFESNFDQNSISKTTPKLHFKINSK